MATKDSTSENPDSECSSFLIASPRAHNARKTDRHDTCHAFPIYKRQRGCRSAGTSRTKGKDIASGGSNDLHTLILKITGGPEGVRQISGTVQGDPRLLHVHDHLYRLPLR